MRNFRIFAAAIMLAAILAVSASAQGTARPTAPQQTGPAAGANANVPESKIAYIDTSEFADEKTGINRYVTQMKTLEREFKPRQDELTNMQARIKTIADEISRLTTAGGASPVDPKTFQAKQDEGERLGRDLKYKKEQADADFAKRYQEVIRPVSQDIMTALNQFAQTRGITMILDISRMGEAVLTVNPSMDVTRAFIAEYNAKNPATASAGPR